MSFAFTAANLDEVINGFKSTIIQPAVDFTSPSSFRNHGQLILLIKKNESNSDSRHGHAELILEDNVGNEVDSQVINLGDPKFLSGEEIPIQISFANAFGGATSLRSKDDTSMLYRVGTDKFGGAGGKAIITIHGRAPALGMQSKISGVALGLPAFAFHRNIAKSGGHYEIVMPFVVA